MNVSSESGFNNYRSFVRRKINEPDLNVKEKSTESTSNLTLTDLSLLTRIGFRGENAKAHIESMQLPIPTAPNLMKQDKHSSNMTLRLSENEYWILGRTNDDGKKLLELNKNSVPSNCYPLFCQHSHAWFLLSGKYIEQTMAKICGVDLREPNFPVDAIVQTSVARVNAIIVRYEENGIPVFSILSDSASAEYLWDALLDAMNEFDGKVVVYDPNNSD